VRVPLMKCFHAEQYHISWQPPPPGAVELFCNTVATIIFPSGHVQTSSVLPMVRKPGVELGCTQLEETDRKHSYLGKVKTLEYYV